MFALCSHLDIHTSCLVCRSEQRRSGPAKKEKEKEKKKDKQQAADGFNSSGRDLGSSSSSFASNPLG